MRFLDLPAAQGRQVDRFDSVGVTALGLVRTTYSVTTLRVQAGGLIGRHAATQPQLLVIIAGRGWTSGDDGARVAIEAGQAVFFSRPVRNTRPAPTPVSPR
ncbi:hypothetical protein [Fodinicola feengrottensis]|uniref:hypothetical protein n=1 Tax=Fodinicola feengrottensis TaxID=435914 RepID=UPI0013D4AAD3|nr:hypothetical protein [Fodinicola feengrottensis]